MDMKKIENWFNTINFGYNIEAINIVKHKEDFGVLVFKTTINNIKGRLQIPFIFKNDTSKLRLTNIDRDIESQYYQWLTEEFENYKFLNNLQQ
tara:strand:- start:355 stop:633 length:279 start_codon:yes stop_codon:yes gene_type:complete